MSIPPAGWLIVYRTFGANTIDVVVKVSLPLLALSAIAPVMVPSKLPLAGPGDVWRIFTVNVSLTVVAAPGRNPPASINPMFTFDGLRTPRSNDPPPVENVRLPGPNTATFDVELANVPTVVNVTIGLAKAVTAKTAIASITLVNFIFLFCKTSYVAVVWVPQVPQVYEQLF